MDQELEDASWTGNHEQGTDRQCGVVNVESLARAINSLAVQAGLEHGVSHLLSAMYCSHIGIFTTTCIW